MTTHILETLPARDLAPCASPAAAYERLQALYDEAAATIHDDFEAYVSGTFSKDRCEATYPYVVAQIAEDGLGTQSRLSYGKVSHHGFYATTVTAPHLFKAYLIEQMTLLQENHDARFFVGWSDVPLPLPFALERATSAMTVEQRQDAKRYFAMPNLAATNDDIVDGTAILKREGLYPLTLFSAQRTDYSLHRLRHYTGTDPSHFQSFVLFTNYQRYVDEFADYAKSQVETGAYARFVEPGNRIHEQGESPNTPPLKKMPQMPAYHLVHEDGTGVTLVNIGVGPSNAKTITDHLAVLRAHVWLMIGHCGGLRGSQRMGDYVLAHAYLRDDHVLDQALPTAIPLPTIAEVQVALSDAVSTVADLPGSALKQRVRTGTVVTTDDRNWELRYHELAVRFNQSRAIAIDMESATIAANGYRFRVPYGTLLCVSDRPLHGEIKLPGMADRFYEESVSQHLRIGLKALDLLREDAKEGSLHSRKLRSFDEPAFR
ncbi:MAG: AMP nucleosidase [Pseudomonadota bacterium]